MLDRVVKIVDVGRNNVGVAVLRRGALKPGGALNGINHTNVSEVYYVVSGGGTMVMGTDVKDVRPVAADNEIVTTAVGPSNNATFVKPAQTRTIKAGDVVVIPVGVYHGFSEIPDHIEYVSVRPDLDKVLPAGYIHPAIESEIAPGACRVLAIGSPLPSRPRSWKRCGSALNGIIQRVLVSVTPAAAARRAPRPPARGAGRA